ncbi:helix-turn-helix domain-containing protein [uncultured Sphingomonas sp.]|uniref:helix-turn-helix domain-containing protein n=1 Tax=uncultured Sphingomonas sp. TaxID=158754 RepID=UPI0035C981AA
MASGAEPRVAVRIHRPCEALIGYITFFYFVDIGGPLTDFLYPEWGNVRFSIAGQWDVLMDGFESPPPRTAALFGPTDRPGRIVTTGGRCIGFGMTPIGWHRLIGGDASEMANRIAPLEHRLGFDGEALLDALVAEPDETASVATIERLLLARLATRPPVSPAVRAVDRALRMRPAEVVEFAELAELTERTLYRLCLKTFGFAPKRLMRLQRFLDTLGQVRSAIGGQVRGSIDSYFDQAHFYRDFRDFMGMTPRAYFGAPRRLMAAAAMEQMRAGVSLSFRLPPQPGDDEPERRAEPPPAPLRLAAAR